MNSAARIIPGMSTGYSNFLVDACIQSVMEEELCTVSQMIAKIDNFLSQF